MSNQEYHQHFYTVEGQKDTFFYFKLNNSQPSENFFSFNSEGRYLDRYVTVKEVDFPAFANYLGVDLNLQNMYNQAKIAFKNMGNCLGTRFVAI